MKVKVIKCKNCGKVSFVCSDEIKFISNLHKGIYGEDAKELDLVPGEIGIEPSGDYWEKENKESLEKYGCDLISLTKKVANEMPEFYREIIDCIYGFAHYFGGPLESNKDDVSYISENEEQKCVFCNTEFNENNVVSIDANELSFGTDFETLLDVISNDNDISNYKLVKYSNDFSYPESFFNEDKVEYEKYIVSADNNDLVEIANYLLVLENDIYRCVFEENIDMVNVISKIKDSIKKMEEKYVVNNETQLNDLKCLFFSIFVKKIFYGKYDRLSYKYLMDNPYSTDSSIKVNEEFKFNDTFALFELNTLIINSRKISEKGKNYLNKFISDVVATHSPEELITLKTLVNFLYSIGCYDIDLEKLKNVNNNKPNDIPTYDIKETKISSINLQQYDTTHNSTNAFEFNYNNTHSVKCPYCGSTNVRKISNLKRGLSVYFHGVASSKIGNQWHCDNCTSDF